MKIQCSWATLSFNNIASIYIKFFVLLNSKSNAFDYLIQGENELAIQSQALFALVSTSIRNFVFSRMEN